MKERIVIIDHESHELIVEDIDIDVLNEKYNGEEEAYIEDHYKFDGEWSWDYILDATYIDENRKEHEIDFSFV